uniref:Uncharacterized protein n=1 Tax=Ixodes ricinus TaxID=34613 RepID=V5H1P3_IXORI
MSSDRVTAAAVAAESPAARTSSAAVLTAVSSSASTVALSNKVVGGLPASALTANSMSSQHTQDSVGDDTGVDGDDADFEVEPSNLMEQSMTTENVPVFADVASSSQAAALASESQQSHHTGSTSDNSALVPVPASLPSDISISSQLDIKPSPSSLIPPFEEQALSPAVPPQPSGSGSGDGSSGAMMMAFTDMSGVPAIAGPSSYHPDNQQSTPSHGKYSRPSPPPLRFPQPLKGRQIPYPTRLRTISLTVQKSVAATDRCRPRISTAAGFPASGFATV